VIAASSHGKVKTVLQVVAIVCFLLKDSALLQDLLGSTGQQLFGTVSWVIMGAAIVMTVISMIDYFYHARDILTGPWEREG
jgi:phosphatidylglycerophosphate synthase